MSESSDFPDKYLSLFDPSVSSNLVSIKLQAEEHNSMLSSLPPIATSIDAFLDSKIQFLESKKHYLQIYNHEIRGLQRVGETDNVDLKDEIIKTTEEEFSTARESLILKRGRRPIKEDMAGEVENGPDLQDAFRAAMVDRIRLCTSQQKPVEFDKKKFRKEVDDYHSGDEDFGAWYHLTGWQSKIMIKAAHLVPKSLDRETCRRLFGGDVDPATDVRNCKSSYPDIGSQETDFPSASFVTWPRSPARQKGYRYSADRR